MYVLYLAFFKKAISTVMMMIAPYAKLRGTLVAFANCHGRTNHSGPHTNVRRGPFSHTPTQDFLYRGALFFSQKVDDLVIRQRSSTQRGKKLAVDRGGGGLQGAPGGVAPSHCTTGTMDNPALLIAMTHTSCSMLSCRFLKECCNFSWLALIEDAHNLFVK